MRAGVVYKQKCYNVQISSYHDAWNWFSPIYFMSNSLLLFTCYVCRSLLWMFDLSFAVIFVTTVSGQQHSLQISPTEKSISKPSNNKFVLTCKGQGGDTALFSQLRWYTPQNEEITNESM